MYFNLQLWHEFSHTMPQVFSFSTLSFLNEQLSSNVQFIFGAFIFTSFYILYKLYFLSLIVKEKKVREKSRVCHNHKPQPFPDIKRKRKPTNPNKHKSIKHTKSTKISSLLPKRGNHKAERTEKHKNKMAQGKTYNKSPRRINHKAPKSKTNIGTTALERSVE